MSLTDEEKRKITDAIEKKMKRSECPFCDQEAWSLTNAYIPLLIMETPESSIIGGKHIPTVAMICKNCGYCAQIATKPLAGLPEETQE